MRPNRGVSRGDRGGVRGLRGAVLAYNFLPESKTYIPVRWAFPVREPRDIGIRISQWNKTAHLFDWSVRESVSKICPQNCPQKGLERVSTV